MIQTLTITKAREELTSLVDKASKKLDEYVITVNGTPAAVLISAAEYESWKETNEIMADPLMFRDIRRGEEDIAKGRVYDWEEIKKDLELKPKQHVPDKAHRAGKKRA